MRFNRETQADRAAKNFAKKQVNKAVKKHGKKAAKAAGKAASAATKKIVAMLASALGGPVGLVLFAAIFVLILLPSMIFGSGFGTDSKYDPDDLNNTSVGSSWEDDAELAIEERYKDLKVANFWGDLGTFFTTGHWGQAGARFETEFANAKDADEQGTDGYFSSSNRLIAIINEAFRLSLKNSRIESEAIAMANQTVPEVDYEIRTSAATMRPDDVDWADYEQTQEEQVNNNALELVKFYGLAGGDWAEIGEAGLPLPRDSYYISSRFGWRQLSTGPDYHQGIDMATFGVVGVPIYAVKDGTCTVPAFDGDGYGNYVTIDHGNGLQTRYAHMSAVAVANGQTVTAGEVIGFVGSTGNSSGPHLHFEIITNGTRIDPLSTELGPLIEEAAK